jgi:hypothetical protein
MVLLPEPSESVIYGGDGRQWIMVDEQAAVRLAPELVRLLDRFVRDGGHVAEVVRKTVDEFALVNERYRRRTAGVGSAGSRGVSPRANLGRQDVTGAPLPTPTEIDQREAERWLEDDDAGLPDEWGVAEAAHMLGLSDRAVRARAQLKHLPGRKRRGVWVFDPVDVIAAADADSGPDSGP